MDAETEEPNFFQEMAEAVPDTMSRLVSFLTALWLSSATAHPGFGDFIVNTAKGTQAVVFNELQAASDPVGKSIAFIGGSVCGKVKPIFGVAYENYAEEPDMSKLNLVLMTRAKTVMYKLSEAATEIPKDTWFNKALPLRIFLHGFTDNPTKGSFQTMLAAFNALQEAEGEVNIIALDASSLIKWFYLRASTLVRFIGQELGATLAALVPAGLEPKNIHLLGHSLGSHIAGFAGKQFHSLRKTRVGRISSMDPAGPCFAQLDVELRLSHNDADFVDVLHTDAGVYGLDEAIGHVDIWANGGSEQPGCLLQTCSHSRAWEMMAESVLNQTAMMAVKCDSYRDFRHELCSDEVIVVGYHTPTTARGNFYFITNATEPFGKGREGLLYKNNGLIRTIGLGVQDLFLHK